MVNTMYKINFRWLLICPSAKKFYWPWRIIIKVTAPRFLPILKQFKTKKCISLSLSFSLKSRSLLFNQRHSKTFQFSLHFETCEKKVGKILQILRPRKNTSNNNTENGHSSHTACWIYWLSATSVQPIFQKICVVSQVYIPQPSLWEYKSLGLKLFTFNVEALNFSRTAFKIFCFKSFEMMQTKKILPKISQANSLCIRPFSCSLHLWK